MSLEAFFLPVTGGRLFCLLHRPAGETAIKGAVLYVHPFAEEMNRSRRMAALQAKAMASAGYMVLQVDLFDARVVRRLPVKRGRTHRVAA